VQGLEGNCHPSKLEETLISIQAQGQFRTLDSTQVFNEIFYYYVLNTTILSSVSGLSKKTGRV